MTLVDSTGVEVPESWKVELEAVRKFCPSAIIAGGCLRDLYCGKEPKDIDFFALPPMQELPIEWVGSDIDYEGIFVFLSSCRAVK